MVQGILLAGGTGLRLRPLTEVTNKHLLPVYDEPMIFKPLRNLVSWGARRVCVVVGGESVGDIIRLLGSGKGVGAELTYRYQERAGGIAEALALTEDVVDDEVLAVMLGDNLFGTDLSRWIGEFEESGEVAHLFLAHSSTPERFGVAVVEGGALTQIVEKPERPPSDLVVTGFYLYRPAVFDAIKYVRAHKGYSARGELEITDVNNRLLEMGRLGYTILSGFWTDMGTFETLFRAAEWVRSGR